MSSSIRLAELDVASLATSRPKLDDLQLGQLRHIDNLSRLADNDWRNMMGRLPMQEDSASYRYQLAYSAFAVALAHFHLLPAARVVFQGTLDRLIQKMLEPEVWLYWRNTSIGGNPDTVDLPRLPSEIDPIARDNIMYSAYLQVMTLLYTMLTGDRKYEVPGSLSFRFTPRLWGTDLQTKFDYDQRSLNQTIYWNMVANGYLGVACEPYCVFQICNQVPILGFRLHDQLYGGNIAEEVTHGYLKAWEEFGGSLNDEGHFKAFVVRDKHFIVDLSNVMADAWCGMLMNTWRPSLVRETYARASRRWLIAGEDGCLSVHPSKPWVDMPMGLDGDFGWMAAWASEMGDVATRDGLLRHADRYMDPRWEDGGYFYPRNDCTYDEAGHLTAVNPTMGNALLAYARLNVNDGLRSIYARPWTDSERLRPTLTAVCDGVEVRRACYDDQRPAAYFTFRSRGGPEVEAEVTVGQLPPGADWMLTTSGTRVAEGRAGSVTAADWLAAVRNGDALHLRWSLRKQLDLELIWQEKREP